MQDPVEVTTERVAEWLVNQCANQDGWQIDVRIEVIPATDPCPMTDEDREALREQATAAIQRVHRHLKLRSWCEEEPLVATTQTHGAGPWTLNEDTHVSTPNTGDPVPTEGA